jgi:hypothetical protein
MSPFDCGSQAQVEHRLGCRLGKAEPVSNIEMRAGDGFDTALGEEAVLGRVDGLGIGRNRRDPLHAELLARPWYLPETVRFTCSPAHP